MLILFQPFKVGDEIEAGGASGIVKEIQIFSTIMMTKDNKKVIVPNAKISGDKITIYPK
ncbi:MAG: mechanosensitive ion channel domain-containing protein [Candidatus Omnitrophota bacterium]|jgi:small conductance mechanosensitive channel